MKNVEFKPFTFEDMYMGWKLHCGSPIIKLYGLFDKFPAQIYNLIPEFPYELITTRRQASVLYLEHLGLSSKAAASVLGISVSTLSFIKETIMETNEYNSSKLLMPHIGLINYILCNLRIYTTNFDDIFNNMANRYFFEPVIRNLFST